MAGQLGGLHGLWFQLAEAVEVRKYHISTPVGQRLQVAQRNAEACPEKFLLGSVV